MRCPGPSASSITQSCPQPTGGGGAGSPPHFTAAIASCHHMGSLLKMGLKQSWGHLSTLQGCLSWLDTCVGLGGHPHLGLESIAVLRGSLLNTRSRMPSHLPISHTPGSQHPAPHCLAQKPPEGTRWRHCPYFDRGNWSPKRVCFPKSSASQCPVQAEAQSGLPSSALPLCL